MIRLAHFLPYYLVGGVEQMVLELCRFRDRTAFECVVAAPQEWVIADEIRRTGVPVWTGTGAFKAAIQWADLVNIHWGLYMEEFHRFVERHGKPYVTTLHGRARLPRIEAVTICTSFGAYDVQRFKDRCVVIQNGVDTRRFAPRPKPRRDKVVITRVCRTSKCTLYFWTAMRRVLERYPQAELWIVGNEGGPQPGEWERVRFLGIRRDVPDILAQSDIFAYTPAPTYGTRDLVVLEALASGVPCVVSDVPCVRESVTQGETGFLTRYGDPIAFADAIARLIEDPELRERMGKEAARRARAEFDIRDVAKRYEAVYRGVMEGIAARPSRRFA